MAQDYREIGKNTGRSVLRARYSGKHSLETVEYFLYELAVFQ
jgi:hypothetical protein